MTPISVKDKVSVRTLQRLGMLRGVADDLSGSPATWTLTVVVTPGSNDDVLNPTDITIDYASS